ncbi:MAG: hypothetical protein V2J07_00830 [Anaerolineae bacterium]|jgi:hypothetical protein|nr:hypothetical protein [Anaerolineae bacterium]
MKKTKLLGVPEVHFKLSQDRPYEKIDNSKNKQGLSSTPRTAQYLLRTM